MGWNWLCLGSRNNLCEDGMKTSGLHNNRIKVSVIRVTVIYSFNPLACAECDVSLPFSGASSIPLCYVLFPATLLHQLFFHPLSRHLAICFLVCLSIFLFPNSCIIPFWEFCFLPFSVHAQTNLIYLSLLRMEMYYI